MYNTHEIDLSSAHGNKELDLGHLATRIRVIHHGGNIELALAPGAPLLPVTHVGQLFRLGCEGGVRVGKQRIFYTNPAGSGTVKLFSSDDESDVDFSGAGASDPKVELVLATVVLRTAPFAGLRTTNPFLDNDDPMAYFVSGDGNAETVYDTTNQLLGLRFQIPAGATVQSHAGGRLDKFNLPLAQILNTVGIPYHRGRDFYYEFADTIRTVASGTNTIHRGFGFGQLNYAGGSFSRPFIGLFCSHSSTEWFLWAKSDVSGQVLSIPLFGYVPEEIHAVQLRIGQENEIPYVEIWMDGFVAHREIMPLGSDLSGMDAATMEPWLGCHRALASESVELWGLLGGAMTLKLVYPNG